MLSSSLCSHTHACTSTYRDGASTRTCARNKTNHPKMSNEQTDVSGPKNSSKWGQTLLGKTASTKEGAPCSWPDSAVAVLALDKHTASSSLLFFVAGNGKQQCCALLLYLSLAGEGEAEEWRHISQSPKGASGQQLFSKPACMEVVRAEEKTWK